MTSYRPLGVAAATADLARRIRPMSFLRAFLGCRAGREVAGRRTTAMILDFFLVTTELTFELFNHNIHSGQDVRVVLAGNKVVLVLGGNQKLDHLHVAIQVYGDFD